MRSSDDIPKVLQDVFYLDNIGEHMERYYNDLYSLQQEKKEMNDQEFTDSFDKDFLSYSNLYSSCNPNY